MVSREITEDELVLLEAVKRTGLSSKDVLNSLTNYYAEFSKHAQVLGIQVAKSFGKLSEFFGQAKEGTEKIKNLKRQLEQYGYTPYLTRVKKPNEARVVLTEADVKVRLPDDADILITAEEEIELITGEVSAFEVVTCCGGDVRTGKFLGMSEGGIVIFGYKATSQD